jgi:hypothetical protein
LRGRAKIRDVTIVKRSKGLRMALREIRRVIRGHDVCFFPGGSGTRKAGRARGGRLHARDGAKERECFSWAVTRRKRGGGVLPGLVFGSGDCRGGDAVGCVVRNSVGFAEVGHCVGFSTPVNQLGNIRGPPGLGRVRNSAEGDRLLSSRKKDRRERTRGFFKRERGEGVERRTGGLDVRLIGVPVRLVIIKGRSASIRREGSRKRNRDGDREMIRAKVMERGPRSPRSNRGRDDGDVRRGARASRGTKVSRKKRIVKRGVRRVENPGGKRGAKRIRVRVKGIPVRMMDIEVSQNDSRRRGKR